MSAGFMPDLGYWVGESSRLRALESRLVDLWASGGYAEVLPPLLLPEAFLGDAVPDPPATRALSLSNGEADLALRADFTSGVAWMACRRVVRLDGPLRLCYRGSVMRRCSPNAPEGIEMRQAGCERLSPEPGPEGDLEVVLLAAETLATLGLEGAVLELGDRQIAGPLLDGTGWPEEARPELERALDLKSLSLLEGLGEKYGRPPEWRLLSRLLHSGGDFEGVGNLASELRAAGVGEAWDRLAAVGASARAAYPRLAVRVEPTDVRRWSYYTGLTLKAFAPSAPRALLSGGRYDGLYPSLDRPFGACGFAVYLGRLLETCRSSWMTEEGTCRGSL
jgi:ATP phosphoribosyltransferase regulatory subunit